MIFTTITIEDESSEDLAFMKAVEEFDDWRNEDEQSESNIYSYVVVLIEKKYVYYDFGNSCHWSYEFEIRSK